MVWFPSRSFLQSWLGVAFVLSWVSTANCQLTGTQSPTVVGSAPRTSAVAPQSQNTQQFGSGRNFNSGNLNFGQGQGQGQAAGLGQGANSNSLLGAGIQGKANRFVRGNRSKQDFVGSNRSELSGFVGVEQALGVGRVNSAVDNLKIETKGGRTNTPLPPQPAKGMYYPRLEFDFEDLGQGVPRPSDLKVSSQLKERIQAVSQGRVDIMVKDGDVVLKGAVDSKRTSELIENLLRFEPGIDHIINELVVRK